MNISATTPPIYNAYSPGRTSTVASPNAASFDNKNTVSSEYPYLTAGDVSVLDWLDNKSGLADLDADPRTLKTMQWINQDRKEGRIQGSLANYMPGAHLTASDAQLVEGLTGTNSIEAAMASSQDACSLITNIDASRQDGSLVGDISTGYLQKLLTASQQLAASGFQGGLASPDFLEKAIADVQDSGSSSGSTLDSTA